MQTALPVSNVEQIPPSIPSRSAEIACVVLACLLSALWCVTAARQIGATFDEPLYVAEGLNHWRTASPKRLMKYGTMPLPVDAQTLPLYLWERCHGITIDPEADFHKVLPWARACTLLFWWMLLVY